PLPFFIVGIYALARRSEGRRGLVLVAAIALATLASGLVYHRDLIGHPDAEAYLLPLVVGAVLVGATGASLLCERGSHRAFAPGLAFFLAISLLPTWPLPRLSQERLAETTATEFLQAMPPRGAGVIRSDHLLFPAWYAQAVEGTRPD